MGAGFLFNYIGLRFQNFPQNAFHGFRLTGQFPETQEQRLGQNSSKNREHYDCFFFRASLQDYGVYFLEDRKSVV